VANNTAIRQGRSLPKSRMAGRAFTTQIGMRRDSAQLGACLGVEWTWTKKGAAACQAYCDHDQDGKKPGDDSGCCDKTGTTNMHLEPLP